MSFKCKRHNTVLYSIIQTYTLYTIVFDKKRKLFLFSKKFEISGNLLKDWKFFKNKSKWKEF